MRTATRVALVLSCAFVGLAGCAKQTAPGFGTFVDMTPTPADDGGADSTTPIIIIPPPVNDDASLSVSDSSGDAPPGTTVSLVFDPMSATVVIDGTGPQSASFTLKATDANGNVQTVSPNSIQFDRPDLGSVTLALPVVATAPATASATPYGGTGTIHAIYNGLEAKATFTVQVHLTRYGMGLSATSPGVVALNAPADGSTLAADPAPGLAALLYPYDHTVWPLGLQTPLLMWSAPQAMDVYRLRYAEKNYTVDSFMTLAALPGQARLEQTSWDRLTNSNDTLHGGQDSIAFTLSRWDSVKQMAYASASQTWSVAPESLRGAIYYWSASQSPGGGPRIGHISRFQPGPGAAPQVLNNGVCMGCHAVNAQGTVLVADLDDQKGGTIYPSKMPYDNWSTTRAWGAFDITQPNTPSIYQSNKFGGDIALTPDGKYLVFGGPAAAPGSKYLSLGDPRTGMVIANSGLDTITLDPGTSNLEMPAFSPDGKTLALVESQWAGNNSRDNVLPAAPERIVSLKFNEAVPSFEPTLSMIVDGTSPAFATTGAGLAYPSFTPDSKAIAFHAGKTPTGCNAGCDDTSPDDGNLFVTLVSGGTPIRLAVADDPPDPMDRNASVEPTFNPVVRGGYAWAVFTSMRTWGNQPWPPVLAAYPNCKPVAGTPGSGLCNGKRRLWLTAVDSKIGTTDPSHPAIYLEGQEDTPNMRGFYTLAPCIPTFHGVPIDAGTDDAQSSSSPGIVCANGFECCSGFCDTGVCVDVSKQSCVGLGGACTMTSDCCNAGVVKCIAAADGGMVCAYVRPP